MDPRKLKIILGVVTIFVVLLIVVIIMAIIGFKVLGGGKKSTSSQQQAMTNHNQTMNEIMENNTKGKTIYSMILIEFYLGQNWVPFHPEQQGLGGSETAVVELSKYLRQRGMNVIVYGRFTPPGIYHKDSEGNGVIYKDYQSFDPNKKGNLLILWRVCGARILPQLKRENYSKIVLDLHDADPPQAFPIQDVQTKVSRIALKSGYQLQLYYPHLDPIQMKYRVVPNGITDIVEYREMRTFGKNPKKFIYTSCYTRGLEGLLKYTWPMIRQKIPDAELHIFYGMDQVRQPFKGMMEKLIQDTPGVKEYGRKSRSFIRNISKDALIHLYPCILSLEIDCISVRESSIAGIIPVIPNQFVFKERAGAHFDAHDSGTKEFFERAAETCFKVIEEFDNGNYDHMFQKMLPVIEKTSLTWDMVADLWSREILFS